MSNPMIRSEFTNYFLDTMLPAIRWSITEEDERRPDQYPNFFNVTTTDRSIEQVAEVTGFGTFAQVNEASKVRYDTILQAPTKNYIPVDWALGFRTSHRMMADDKFGLVKNAAKALLVSAKETVEINAASVYNNGFSSSFNGPDGVPLFSTAHVLYGGGTQANRPATDADLDIASLEAGITQFRKFVDHRGKKARMLPRTLVVPPELAFTAAEILNSPGRSDTANNTINAFKNGGVEGGMINVKVYEYLTDPDAWFLITDLNKLRIRFIWREKPTTMHDVDFDSRSLKTAMWECFVAGFDGYQGAYGTTGA